MTTVVALGDSVTSGEGVGIITPAASVWASVLAAHLGAESFTNLARAGARLAHVRDEQLATAVATRPTVATLCVGLNDVVKTGCPPEEIRRDVLRVVGSLREVGATVVVTRLHDPSAVFRLPRGLAAQIAGRVQLFRDAVAETAEGDPGVVVVDLAPLQGERACWAVDRVHPSVHGQRRLASLAAEALGWPPLLDAADPPPPASTGAHVRWLIRSGAPWLAHRFPEVGPPVAGMAVRAVRQRLALSPR